MVSKVSLCVMAVVALAVAASGSAEDQATSGPPPFFLQDPTDSFCLAGEVFKRCSIDTLFYVIGKPGSYQIHKRSIDGVIDEEDDGTCITKKSCKEGDESKVMEVKLGKCSHCGAKRWNILGDSETGYVLTEGDGVTCLVRQQGTNKAVTAPCDSEDVPYTPLQLHFASSSDIKTMASAGARMIAAAHDGDKKAIQALLKEDDVTVNVRDWDDLTALIPAAANGNLDLCKFLVKEGIDVNAQDKDGITALMEASIMGQTKVVEFLLSNGAEVDATSVSGVTALWLASSEGKTDAMKILLEKGASASIARSDGITALMTASMGGHADAVKLLLDHGGNAIATDNDGLTPLMNAAENGTVAVLKLLVEFVDEPRYVDAMSNTGFSALIIASAHGHKEAVEFLLNAGADANAVSPDNNVTPLMYAAASNHIDVMKALLDIGKANLEAKHTNGGTALLEAATGGAVESIRFLLERGAVFDESDDDGVTPLMAIVSQGSLEGYELIMGALETKLSGDKLVEYINMFSYSGGSSVMFAAAGGHADCTQKLIEKGADVKAIARATPEYLVKLKEMIAEGKVSPDEDPHVDGVTALHVAAQGGHLECVKALIAAGADTNVADDENRTPLTLAVKGNYADVAYTLVEAGADPNTIYVDEQGESHNLLFDSILVENEEFAKLLIEKGAKVDYKDEKQVSTLLQASHRGFSELVALLIEKGAPLEDASDEGVTPLIAASSEGQLEAVKLLIAAKADLNAKDKDGTTALMAASARGNVDVVKELLNAGVSINDQNSDGHTALMFAYNGKNQVETLWERYNMFVNEQSGSGDAKAEGSSGSEVSADDVDDSGTGPIIRQALDNHTALVELLLQSGADTKLKDKEGHTAKDFDYQAEAKITTSSTTTAGSSTVKTETSENDEL